MVPTCSWIFTVCASLRFKSSLSTLLALSSVSCSWEELASKCIIIPLSYSVLHRGILSNLLSKSMVYSLSPLYQASCRHSLQFSSPEQNRYEFVNISLFWFNSALGKMFQTWSPWAESAIGFTWSQPKPNQHKLMFLHISALGDATSNLLAMQCLPPACPWCVLEQC